MGAELEQKAYKHLTFEHPSDGVLLITMNRPERLNAADEIMHAELSRVWRDISDDPAVRAAVITGSGSAFSAGGDLAMVDRQVNNYKAIAQVMQEAHDLVYNIINCEKPIISAINGVAVGAGLAVALLADISIIAEDARLTDGHLRLGVGAGDHAAMIWPILCGMAKAKYYLLTSEFIGGREAERIGLVSLCMPTEQVLDAALEVAARLAHGPQAAIRSTKHSLNNWLRLAGPAFDASLAMEMLHFFGDDVVEGSRAIREKRAPQFPSARRGSDDVDLSVR